MKNSATQTQKILSFLYDEMSTNEKNAFEREMNQNPELKKEVEMHQKVDKALKLEMEVEDFKNKLKTIHAQHIDENNKGKILNLNNKWYWAAASITLFSGTALYSLVKQKSPNQLYNKYYKVWEPAQMTRGLSTETEMGKITFFFENGNYKQSLELISSLPTQVVTDPKIMLIKACSLMELEKFEDAVAAFKKFDSQDYTFYTETSQWYKALCYLKMEEQDMATRVLSNIAKNKGTYANEAKELLDKMK